MKNIFVYYLIASDVDISPNELQDFEFVQLAEKLNQISNLIDFQYDFNNGNLDLDRMFIRFYTDKQLVKHHILINSIILKGKIK